MKKTLIAMSLFAAMGFAQTVQAAPIFGIKIHIEYERGAKVSGGGCEGKGCCKFKIEFDGMMPYQGDLSKDDNGRLILILGQEYSQKFPKDFTDGQFPVNQMDFKAGDLSSLGIKEALTVPTGSYPVKYDAGLKSWYVVLQ